MEIQPLIKPLDALLFPFRLDLNSPLDLNLKEKQQFKFANVTFQLDLKQKLVKNIRQIDSLYELSEKKLSLEWFYSICADNDWFFKYENNILEIFEPVHFQIHFLKQNEIKFVFNNEPSEEMIQLLMTKLKLI